MGIKYKILYIVAFTVGNTSGLIMWKMLKRSYSEEIILIKPTYPQYGYTISSLSTNVLVLPSEEVSVLFISSLSCPSHYVLEYLSI